MEQGFFDRIPASVLHLGWLVVAAVAAWLAVSIVVALVRRWLPPTSAAADVFQALRAPSYRVFPLAAAVALEPLAPDERSVHLLHHLLLILLIVAVTWGAGRLVNAVTGWIAARHPTDVEDNLMARRVQTQARVLAHAINALVVVIGLAAVLITFPGARRIGSSLLASAGLAGLAAGLAARPVLANLIAGLQIALTQPIRLDDIVVVENEWGRIEEIGATYIVVKLWDERRQIVPLNYFLEHPFVNWTRTNSSLLTTVTLWADYGVPLGALRDELRRLCESSPLWDRRVCQLTVNDVDPQSLQLRALMSTAHSDKASDLAALVREGLVEFLQRQYPQFLPRRRQETYAVGKVPAPSASGAAAA